MGLPEVKGWVFPAINRKPLKLNTMTIRALQGLYVNYVSEGQGPPVILVHGVGGSLHHWDQLILELVHQKYQIFALDLLGHGDSAKPDSNGFGYHIDAIYAHMANWISRLDLHTSPMLIGHATGAYLVLTYALRNPGKVRGMVLSNPYFTPDQLSLLLRFPVMQPQLSAKILNMAPKWTISSAFALTQRGGDQFTKESLKRMAEDFKRIDPAVITFARTTKDLTPHLKRIKTKAVVIWGEGDPLFNPALYPDLVNALKDASACPLSGGHNLHLTNIRQFNNQVLKFLELLSGGNLSPNPKEKIQNAS